MAAGIHLWHLQAVGKFFSHQRASPQGGESRRSLKDCRIWIWFLKMHLRFTTGKSKNDYSISGIRVQI